MATTLDQWAGRSPDGVATREFRISRVGRRDITGALWMPDTPSGARSLVCFGHGASGDRYQFPASRLAADLTAQGIAMLSVEGPDHGLRQTGEGGRAGMIADLLREDAMSDMCDDWNEAVELVCARNALDPARIGYFGLSMGSAYGIGFLAQRSRVAVAVLGLWADVEAIPHNETVLACARALTAPTLFLTQLDDEFLPVDGSISLFSAIGSADKRLHLNPGVHAEIPLDEVDFAAQFLTEHMTGPRHGSPDREMGQIVDAEPVH